MIESDWKKFSALIPVWRERYLAERNARVAGVLTDPRRNETERFWAALDLMQKESKTLHRCLDDLRRSRMWLSLVTMRGAGMLKKEDLAGFSEELQQQVFDDPFEKRG